jgi:hypothetical protein
MRASQVTLLTFPAPSRTAFPRQSFVRLDGTILTTHMDHSGAPRKQANSAKGDGMAITYQSGQMRALVLSAPQKGTKPAKLTDAAPWRPSEPVGPHKNFN